MQQSEIAARLVLIEERLTRIEAAQIGGSVPAHAVAQALADIEKSYGLAAQLVEVAHIQREQIEALIRRLDELIALLTDHDARLVAYTASSDQERGDLKELLVQLRELARKQVRGQADLVRALGDDGAWDGADRRNSIADRRRAS